MNHEFSTLLDSDDFADVCSFEKDPAFNEEELLNNDVTVVIVESTIVLLSLPSLPFD